MRVVSLDYDFRTIGHRNAQNLAYRLIIIPLLGYLAYVPLGPFPIYVRGILLAHLIAVFVAFFSIAFIPAKVEKRVLVLIVCVCVFMFANFISVAFSSHFDLSLRSFLVTTGFAFVALSVPFVMQYRIPFFRGYIFVTAILVSLLILYLDLILGWGTNIRLALAWDATGTEGRVDPNMTAIGLIMSAIIYIPNFLQSRQRKRWEFVRFIGSCAGIILIMSSSFVLWSRTSIVALVLGVFWGVAILLFKFGAGKLFKRIGQGGYITLPKTMILVLSMVLLVWWQWSEVVFIFERLFSAIVDEQHETGRITLFFQAIDLWLQDINTLFVGVGYFTTNPHNEFLRALSGGGIIGFCAFLLLLSAFYTVCCLGRRHGALYLFSQNVLFGYICVAMLFYGHTKTLWVALMFLLANYLHERLKSKGVVGECNSMI